MAPYSDIRRTQSVIKTREINMAVSVSNSVDIFVGSMRASIRLVQKEVPTLRSATSSIGGRRGRYRPGAFPSHAMVRGFGDAEANTKPVNSFFSANLGRRPCSLRWRFGKQLRLRQLRPPERKRCSQAFQEPIHFDRLPSEDTSCGHARPLHLSLQKGSAAIHTRIRSLQRGFSHQCA